MLRKIDLPPFNACYCFWRQPNRLADIQKNCEEGMERINYENPDGELEDPAAVFEKLNGKRPSPATCCRWARDGIAGNGGERIRLQVWYVGRQPRTTRKAALLFLAELTAAQRNRVAKKGDTRLDATRDELRAAGLLSEVEYRAKNDE